MNRWTRNALIMLSPTLAALVLELVFAFDQDPDTPPLTDIITQAPYWLFVPPAAGLCLWLVPHLIHARWVKIQARRKARTP